MNWLRHLRISAVNRHQWMGGALLALFLTVLTLTLSETLHHEVHAEAGDPEHHQEHHQCAVTMLQSGQVDVPVVTVVPVPGKLLTSVALQAELNFIPAVASFLPPSCGPPALLS
jgi:hypothetical protein